MAYQARDTGRTSDAVQLMDVAVAEAKATPAVVQAIMWGRAGNAYAKAGNAQAARKALNDASRQLARANDGDTPSWAYWFDETSITCMAGIALFDLGDYAGATRELTTYLQARGAAMPRDRAIDLGRLATAQLRTGNLEAGCESGRQAGTDSPYFGCKLREVPSHDDNAHHAVELAGRR